MKTVSTFLSIYFILFLSGCNLSNSGTEVAEPEFEQYFEAEVNGKQWKYNGELRASLMNLHGLPWLNLYGVNSNESIHIVAHYDSSRTDYNVLRKIEENGRTTGGAFVESAGDVRIARYDPVDDLSNKLFIELNKDENAGPFVTGTFSMTVVIQEVYESKNTQKPDTIKITNGKFRALLEVQE